MTQPIGFSKDLFVMPFDHRGSFAEKLFGIKGRQPTPEETVEISKYKNTIYQGFKMAISQGVPKDKAGILVDEQFGSAIIQDAKKNGFMTAVPAEKSGQNEFDFEYGNEFGAHIAKFGVTFVKVLVRYNPEDDATLNKRQLERLKKLSDYCHQNGNKFMFELLVPATPAQLAKFGGENSKYDKELRPSLMLTSMKEIQAFGIEADIWKIEGVDSSEDCLKLATLARSGTGRENVGCILLGRGENGEKVKHWLTAAANVPGFVGFAVGRTIFWDALKGVKDGKWSHEKASEMVCANYKGFCDLWMNARK